MTSFVIFTAFLWAGIQNALAGGGSFITLPALMLTGMDPRAANITSTIALFPAQSASGLTGKSLAAGAGQLSFGTLALISLVGGALGAALLLVTPSSFFTHIIPWLVLFATGVFAWGSFVPRKPHARALNRTGAAAIQLAISIYGGYFGGAIGFLMLAMLTAAGQSLRAAGATKNALAALMNASAVLIFVFSAGVSWRAVILGGAGAAIGGVLGALVLKKINERVLRVLIVVIGVALTVGLFLRSR